MNKQGLYKCRYCGKEFSQSSDISRHYKYESQDCYTKWKIDKEAEFNNKPRVKCEICGDLLRNISNTHCQKHSITQQQYKEKFPNALIFSVGLLDIQKNNREKTIDERYTKEEIKQLRSISSNKIKSLPEEERKQFYDQVNKKTKETILKKYKQTKNEFYKDVYNKTDKEILKQSQADRILKFKNTYNKLKEDITAWEIHKLKRLEKRIKTNIEKYGVDFAQKLEATKQKQRDSLVKNFGSLKNAYDIISSKSIESRLQTYGRINFCPVFSIESQNLFKRLHEEIQKRGMFTVYYAINGNEKGNNEYQVLIKNGSVKFRFLDFYVKELNKFIEFNEHYHDYEKTIEADKIRLNEIYNNISDIKHFIVSQSDWLKEPEKIINDCILFLFNV